ncbi:MAG: type II toxin -antitoxin system TacA 1-like antitoxin [Thermomicrobiales bacterium]
MERAETLEASERDLARILDLLEHPPTPNEKLKAAIAALPETL